MKRKLLIPLKILISLATICLVILGFKHHIYNTFENLFIDKCNSIVDSNSFSPFTAWANIAAGTFLLFILPQYFLELFEPTRKKSDLALFVFATIRKCYALVILFVTFIMLPAGVIGGLSFEDSLGYCFGEGNIYHHLFCPLLFIVLSFLEKGKKQSKNQSLVSMIPVGFYMVLYVLMVFVFKTWEDFYYISTLYDMIGFFVFPIILILMFGVNVLIAIIDNQIVLILNKES